MFNAPLLLYLCVADNEGRVSRHEKVAPRCRNQRGHQPDQVVVHVARVPQGGGRGGHDRADNGVQLPHGGVGDAQAIDLRGGVRGRREKRRYDRISAQSQMLSHLLSPPKKKQPRCAQWMHLTGSTVRSAPSSQHHHPQYQQQGYQQQGIIIIIDKGAACIEYLGLRGRLVLYWFPAHL